MSSAVIPDRSAGRALAWYAPALWFVAILPYPWFPAAVQDVVYPATAFGVVVALLAGVRLFRPRPATPWLLLAAAYVFFLLGDLSYLIISPDADLAVPWSDLAYLAFYPLALVCLIRLLKGRVPDRFGWVDALVWTSGAAVPVWEFAIEDTVEDGFDAYVATLVAYPVMDLLLLLVLVKLMTVSRGGSISLRLLTLGLGIQFVTDIVYLTQPYVSGGWMDLGWLASYSVVAIAALHPSMATPAVGRTNEADTRLGWWRIPILLPPALTGPVALAALVWSGAIVEETEDAIVAIAVTFVVLLLAVARGMGLVGLANRRTEALQQRLDMDSLTGLSSRSAFVERLGAVLGTSTAGDRPWVVIFLDLDDFKTVNDTQGHEAGDQLLIVVAQRLREAFPEDATIARFGGDEFAILLRADDVEPFAALALHRIQAPMTIGDREVRLHASIGSAAVEPAATVEELLRRVDVAMHEAKQSSLSWMPYEGRMSATLLVKLDRREQLVRALASGEVVPWFQPVVHLRTGALCGFEALARWVPPNRRPVPAEDWLPLAEDSSLILDVDRTVLDGAIAQLSAWLSEEDAEHLHVAVNLSARTLAQEGIDSEVLRALDLAGVPPARLVIEVTEGVQIKDDQVTHRLQRLRSHAVRIALDDFGTGWSSLSYLQRFPVDILKLDRCFTWRVGQGPAAEAIPSAVAQLAATLGLEVVAEGVETPAQRLRLLQLGFPSAQGYLYGPAMPAEALDEWRAQASDRTTLAIG